ncbi:cation diffusion facilitator family transporter [Gorillibacterium massiliense]|uniref:cation diffusion facilitator family transporter n=1 Tax=Gorillibacterium massiliense TaxID=1280390 RepID=UPI0004BAB5DC|nr:cation diffusion facilitator family transporter [Gorillibacterium massiliense]
MSEYESIKEGERGAWISILAYVFLAGIKLMISWSAGSDALRADGLNNATDIVASAAVLIGLKISRRPPDHDHQYGHFRAETVAALIASLIMTGVGLQVLFSTIQKIINPMDAAPDMIAAWTAVGCAVIMLAVYRYNHRLALKINSKALMAAAKDNRSDAYVSIGAFAGIVGAQLGIPLLDPIAAIIVGALILKTAWDIFREATHSLTDGFDEEMIVAFQETVNKTPGVEQVKDIRARFQGNHVFVDLTVYVDQDLSVKESHMISDAIETRLFKNHKIRHVHVHIEPFIKENSLPSPSSSA